MRLEFDYTLDEMVDSARRAMARSKTVQSMRARSIWVTSIASGVAVPISWWYSSGGGAPTLFMLAIAITVAIVFGMMVYFAYGKYYDWLVTQRTRRILSEQFEKSTSHHCVIETHADVLWVRQDSIEVTHHWNDLEDVLDSRGALELRFRNGLIVVRDRAFASSADRAEFLRLSSSAVAR
jgi:hypothetical protein